MQNNDLIPRGAAISLIEGFQRELCPVGMYSRHAVYGDDRQKFDDWQFIIDELEKIPSVDAAPVVRCKDCSHVYYADSRVPSEQSLVCNLTGRNVMPDWFCADGARMDGENARR